jgi:3-methyladenine DNA glycosylase AlkD
LSKVILENNKTNEFFINKAIGWALRQYARTDRTWVLAFIENSNVSSLSKREALKQVKNYEYYGK